MQASRPSLRSVPESTKHHGYLRSKSKTIHPISNNIHYARIRPSSHTLPDGDSTAGDRDGARVDGDSVSVDTRLCSQRYERVFPLEVQELSVDQTSVVITVAIYRAREY